MWHGDVGAFSPASAGLKLVAQAPLPLQEQGEGLRDEKQKKGRREQGFGHDEVGCERELVKGKENKGKENKKKEKNFLKRILSKNVVYNKMHVTTFGHLNCWKRMYLSKGCDTR